MNISSTFWILMVVACNAVVAIPLYNNMQKRQSDQRIAELETLLALHKYGMGVRRLGGRNAAGYGLIDFNYVGRKKKSNKVSEGGGETRSSSSSTIPKLTSSWSPSTLFGKLHPIRIMKPDGNENHFRLHY